MGYNSVILVLNDRLWDIEKDEKFGSKLCDAIREISSRPNKFPEVSGSQTVVISQEHADVMQIVAIGGNYGRVLGHGNWRDSDEQLLIKLAEKHGYFLTPKERKKKGS
jgi:hypothetical protein